MRLANDRPLSPEPSKIQLEREIAVSPSSSIFEIKMDGETYAMKLYHDNGDPGWTDKGRDLNRYRCELKAYKNLLKHGVCDSGFVPYFYGHIDWLDPAAFQPFLRDFVRDKLHPSAIILEYLPAAESLNCVNYSESLYNTAIEGMKQIHNAHVHHRDIYPKNILLVPGGSDKRLVWVDFDVATTFNDVGPEEEKYSRYEDELVASFGEALREDQRQGLPPNTKFY
ncbi:hypothetical protein BO94DRAFT_567738 [Aspergillus sclerotioniger CBS 115572]|uniref:Protein kinase domain-containing protein n=1 Tax=Aspergillus sclerotioniger CBS 115572 TaxID=1450535 RepID=A0A317VYG6_9EURO|nr:hypothetical protein BO94DRAFT_567738 [Aspergillus sclerotioniger CBS 115572]PWY79404.1 hypothetical protein BO94DRAFT_567738 [Aspergillus sclerotioniger CBS 115572]